MCLLGILCRRLELAGRLGNILGPVTVGDDIAYFVHGDTRKGDGIRAHIADQADVAFIGKLDALVQALGDTHCPLCIKTEFARGFLLQCRSSERRCRIPPALLLLDTDGRQFSIGSIENRLFDFPGRILGFETELFDFLTTISNEPRYE